MPMYLSCLVSLQCFRSTAKLFNHLVKSDFYLLCTVTLWRETRQAGLYGPHIFTGCNSGTNKLGKIQYGPLKRQGNVFTYVDQESAKDQKNVHSFILKRNWDCLTQSNDRMSMQLNLYNSIFTLGYRFNMSNLSCTFLSSNIGGEFSFHMRDIII